MLPHHDPDDALEVLRSKTILEYEYTPPAGDEVSR
jgi:hypothetical protein